MRQKEGGGGVVECGHNEQIVEVIKAYVYVSGW